MVLLTTTPLILSAISSLSPVDRSSLTSLPSTTSNPIDHKTVIALSRITKQYSLNNLLRGTQVYHAPPTPKAQPSAEYLALMARLRKEQEQREYTALISEKGYQKHGGLSSDEEEEDSDDISPSLVLNIVLSIVMCAMAMFYLTRWWNNDGVRVLMSLGTGLVVGIAEVTVYAAYLRKVKESKAKEKRKKEKKIFLGEYTGHEPALPLSHIQTEKEEIWGRGINGGMRRRVREKWEKDQDNNNS